MHLRIHLLKVANPIPPIKVSDLMRKSNPFIFDSDDDVNEGGRGITLALDGAVN